MLVGIACAQGLFYALGWANADAVLWTGLRALVASFIGSSSRFETAGWHVKTSMPLRSC